MPPWISLDWDRLFLPSRPILETIIRGSVTYLALFVMLRFFRRQTGSIGAADLLVLLLIADASQNAMADDYTAISDGLILVATIVGWEYILDAISYYVPAVGRYIERPALPLVQDGQINSTNLKSELMTVEELLSQLRQKGIGDLSQVKVSFIEGDGHISVVTDGHAVPQQSTKKDSALQG